MSTEDENKYKKIELKYKKFDALSRILAAVAAIASAIAAFLALQNYTRSPVTTPNSLPSAPITPPASSPQVDSAAPVKPTTPANTPKSSFSQPTPTKSPANVKNPQRTTNAPQNDDDDNVDYDNDDNYCIAPRLSLGARDSCYSAAF